MKYVVVISELGQLAPAERWPKFVRPVSAELQSSGLGRVLDLDSLRQSVDQSGCIDVGEIAVELVNLGYGRELLTRYFKAVGLKRDLRETPKRWADFHCEDYFGSALAESDYFDKAGQYEYFRSAQEIYEDPDRDFLVIGGRGCDGIEWGFRRGLEGLWAWYPIDAEFVWLASTAESLLEGWLSGRITV